MLEVVEKRALEEEKAESDVCIDDGHVLVGECRMMLLNIAMGLLLRLWVVVDGNG